MSLQILHETFLYFSPVFLEHPLCKGIEAHIHVIGCVNNAGREGMYRYIDHPPLYNTQAFGYTLHDKWNQWDERAGTRKIEWISQGKNMLGPVEVDAEGVSMTLWKSKKVSSREGVNCSGRVVWRFQAA